MYGEMATVRKLSDHFSPDLLFDEDKGLKPSPLYFGISSKCRDEATRTPDPYVPNVVRYQLRYIPMAFWKATAKVQYFF